MRGNDSGAKDRTLQTFFRPFGAGAEARRVDVNNPGQRPGLNRAENHPQALLEAATLSILPGNITLNNGDKMVVDFTGLWWLFGVK